jgi:hypothetical protein
MGLGSRPEARGPRDNEEERNPRVKQCDQVERNSRDKSSSHKYTWDWRGNNVYLEPGHERRRKREVAARLDVKYKAPSIKIGTV